MPSATDPPAPIFVRTAYAVLSSRLRVATPQPQAQHNHDLRRYCLCSFSVSESVDRATLGPAIVHAPIDWFLTLISQGHGHTGSIAQDSFGRRSARQQSPSTSHWPFSAAF